MRNEGCRARLWALLAVSVAMLAACGGGDGAMEVDGVWARTSPEVATAGAAYMDITNSGEEGDALIGASVDSSVAASVEIHETAVAEDDSMTGSTMGGGMMEMRPVERIDLPAGETVSLEPGGYHLMFIDLVEPLETGATVEITLTFENAGEQVVTAEVRETAP